MEDFTRITKLPANLSLLCDLKYIFLKHRAIRVKAQARYRGREGAQCILNIGIIQPRFFFIDDVVSVTGTYGLWGFSTRRFKGQTGVIKFTLLFDLYTNDIHRKKFLSISVDIGIVLLPMYSVERAEKIMHRFTPTMPAILSFRRRDLNE